MQIRIGDEVSFLSDKLDGKVTGIIDAKTVNVYCDVYGFEIPASVDDLVVTKSSYDDIQSSSLSNTKTGISTNATNNIYIAFVPDDFNNLHSSAFNLYLLNDTKYTILYTVATFNGKTYNALSAGNVDPESSFQLGTFYLKDIEERVKRIAVQALSYTKRAEQWFTPTHNDIKIVPANLCKSGAYKQNRYFKGVALLKCIGEDLTNEQSTDLETKQNLNQSVAEPTSKSIDIAVLKQLNTKIREDKKSETSHTQKTIVNPNILEIDLHADALLETCNGMDSAAILEHQIDTFKNTMEKYKLRKGMKIVFIHGKGDGTLRQRINWLLQTTYKRHYHQDASFKQYGYGATQVTIR